MRYGVIITLLAALSGSVQAQSPSASANPSLPGAVAAHGGAILATIGTIQISAHHTLQGKTEPVQISANVLGGEIRVDYGQPVTRSAVVPGLAAGIAPYELTNGNRKNKQAFVGLFGQLDILSGLGIQQFTVPAAQATALGTASINGRAATRLQVTSGRKQTIYFRSLPDTAEVDIDGATGLVSAISRKLSAEQNLDHTFQRTFVFSNFRNVGGLVFPFQIDTQFDGMLLDTLIVDTVVLNPAFSADLFRN
jgi:hypothetical protein